MAHFEAWSGASGQLYQFWVVPLGDAVPIWGGVYLIARQPIGLVAALMGQRLEALYVGKAQDLDQRVGSGLEGHHKWPAFQAAGAQFVGVHLIASEAERTRVEVDLIQGLRPLLNETHQNALAFRFPSSF